MLPGTGPDAAPASGRLRLSAEAAEVIRAEIARAGGREVCFLAKVTEERWIVGPRAVARGNHAAVLAAARDASAGDVMVHNHPTGRLEPSEADLSVAARLYEMGIGTAITDNGARDLYVVVEPPRPRPRILLDIAELAALLAPAGPLSRQHASYEDRPGQREVLEVVARRYNEGGVAVVEAGTGTGKSLAYLLPAARWARLNQERTIVSTNTINLQEQLVGKDLPLVARVLGDDVRWALVKGRGNYVSIRRARLAAESGASLFEDDRSEELSRLLGWIDATDDGSLSDLAFPLSDETWEEVQSDSDVCLRVRCPHFQDCFYQKARRQAASAEVLVANHHLLFSDLAVRRASGNYTQSAVLPPYKHVILDEAHNVEDAATSHMGAKVTRRGLFRMLSRLERRGGRGILKAVVAELGNGEAAERVKGRVDVRVRPAVEEARRALDDLLGAIEMAAPPERPDARRLGSDDLPEPIDQVDVREGLEVLLPAFSDLERELAELRARISGDEALAERAAGRLLDVQSVERRLAGAREGIRLILDPDQGRGRYVRWVEWEGSGRRRNLVLAAAPIEPGEILRDALFKHVETVVLTSATLTTQGRFDFVRGRVGLGPPGAPPAMPWQQQEDEGVEGTLAGTGLRSTGPSGIHLAPGGRRAENSDISEYDLDPGPSHAGAPVNDLDDVVHEDEEALDEETLVVEEVLVPSPFDYASHTILCVPTDLARPGTSGDDFQRATAHVALTLAEKAGGGIFVLFTSYRSLQRVASLLRAAGAEGRWPLFVQGEGQKTALVRGFERAGNGILLGTSSFWEGVDVPGDPLRGLILEKLPFRVPSEPVTAARVEAIERAGGNAFWGYMLPLAALRLKQGFGRLVRSQEDRGAVVLLDDRIVSRRYGRVLRESLPPAPLVKGPWDEVERALDRFYRGA